MHLFGIIIRKVNKILLKDLGLCDYAVAWEAQTKVHQNLIHQKRYPEENSAATPHQLIMCEHPHVYTLGKSGSKDNLLYPVQELDRIGATFYEINRGGDITYHGPGQMVVYPILDLERIEADVHKYVRGLEEVIIKLCGTFQVQTERISGYTGVWVTQNDSKPRKICAIGVHLSRWVSLHGLAFNVYPDLNYFNHIVPCGISPEQMQVTSLEKEIGNKPNLEEVKKRFVQLFLEQFQLDLIP